MTFDESFAQLESGIRDLLMQQDRATKLLKESQEIIKKYEDLVKRLEDQNERLARENGKLRLLADLKDDMARLQ
jgi:predicted transcriptional regulator